MSPSQSVAHVFLAQAIYPNRFMARVVTTVQHHGMARQFYLVSEKAHQRRIGFPFDGRRAQFDLNCAAVLAYDAIAPGIRNHVNSQYRHSADHSRSEINSLDRFWGRMR